MNVGGAPYRSIWLNDDGWSVSIIDQTVLPARLEIATLRTVVEMARAIRTMQVRGAPLIGVAAAYGVALAMREDPSDASLDRAVELLGETRPTAANLSWALSRMYREIATRPLSTRVDAAYMEAQTIADEDVATCRDIGAHGAGALRELWESSGRPEPLQVLTHCNAGWLATVDWGTALAPIYQLHDAGVPVHVWVDETRPRNQGYLTAWELEQHGVPFTLIVDNAGGHLMRRGAVHACIVGADRVSRRGDVINKIGTYLKALAAHDNGVPFYVAAPGSTIDWRLEDPDATTIEERDPAEVTDGQFQAANPAFDVTPAHLVNALITERGVCPPTARGLRSLFPERFG